MVLKRVACLLFAFLVCLSVASAKHYRLPTTVWSYTPVPWAGPQVFIGNGYIKTDGTIGELAEGNIVDFDIRVVGLYPFHFTPQTARLDALNGVVASETELFLAEPLTREQPSLLGFVGESPHFLSFDEFFPSETVLMAWFPDFDSTSSLVVYGQEGAALIATVDSSTPYFIASIPEPTTAALAAIALGGFVFIRRHRRV